MRDLLFALQERKKDLRRGKRGMGKTITLSLIDDNHNGLIKAKTPNWTGVVYKIPRSTLNKYDGIADLKHSGIYFLFGIDEDDKRVIYIGQAISRKNGGGILTRLQEHANSKDKTYWTEAIAVTTPENTLGATEISYLENYFYSLAHEINRYNVKNGNEPNPGNVTEEKDSELAEFASLCLPIIYILGHYVFEKRTETHSFKSSEKKTATETSVLPQVKIPEKNIITIIEELYFTRKGISARGIKTVEGFRVLKGSSIAPIIHSSCPEGARKARKNYSNKIDSNNILIEDLLFPSPSAAADFVGGSSLNGNIMWQTSGGIKLKDLNK